MSGPARTSRSSCRPPWTRCVGNSAPVVHSLPHCILDRVLAPCRVSGRARCDSEREEPLTLSHEPQDFVRHEHLAAFAPVTSRSTTPSVSFRMFDDAAAGVIFSVFAVVVIVIDGDSKSSESRSNRRSKPAVSRPLRSVTLKISECNRYLNCEKPP